MVNFKGMRFPIDVILVCIRWYAAYPGSVALLIKRRNYPWNGTARLKLDGPFLPT